MYRVIMIDDEPWTLRGLSGIIDWNAHGFSVVQTFDNSLKAVDAIMQDPPDVIFSDIRMPFMSGLDLIERCRAAGCDTLFVLVTAYAEFQYAQRAIESGTAFYVLKPLEKTVLEQIAEKLRRLLDAKRDSNMESSVRAMVLSTLTSSLSSKDVQPVEAACLKAPYRICVRAKKPMQAIGGWFTIYEDFSVGIVPEDYNCPDLEACGCSSLSCGSGQLISKIREAIMAYYSAHFYGIDHTLEYNRNDIPGIQALSDAIAAGDTAATHTLLDNLIQNVEQQHFMIDEMTHMYDTLIHAFRIRSNTSCADQVIRPFGEPLLMYSIFHSWQNMLASLRVLVRDSFSDGDINVKDSPKVIQDVVQYVDKNYTTCVSLEQLADRFNISLSYLSRQFKQVTNENYSQYVKNKRIAYACSLLSATDLSVSEIGIRCGYPDYFHFSKIFKKATGQTPTAYRKVRTL